MACTILNTCFLEHICPALVLHPFVFTHFCFNTLTNLHHFLICILSSLTPFSCLPTITLTSYIWCEYHFLFMPSWFIPGFSGLQLWYKTRAGCMTLADTAPNITRCNELINNGTANTVVKILKKRDNMNSHNIGCMCYSK